MNQQMMWCQIGELLLGIELARVRSIQPAYALRLNKENSGPFGWLGTTEGELVIVDLAARLGIESPLPLVQKRVVLVADELGLYGLLVEQVHQALALESGMYYALPEALLNVEKPYFLGVISAENQWGLQLNLDNLHPSATPQLPAAVAPPLDLLAENEEEDDIDPLLFIFKIPGMTAYSLGLTVTQIAEIILPDHIFAVPLSSEFVLGCVSWRDTMIPVIDLARQMGFDHTLDAIPEQYRRVIVFRTPQYRDPIGFYAESTSQIFSPPVPHQPVPLDQWPPSPLVRSVFALPGQTVIIPQM